MSVSVNKALEVLLQTAPKAYINIPSLDQFPKNIFVMCILNLLEWHSNFRCFDGHTPCHLPTVRYKRGDLKSCKFTFSEFFNFVYSNATKISLQ